MASSDTHVRLSLSPLIHANKMFLRADIGFDSTENEVAIVGRDGERHVAKTSKEAVAGAILDEVERLLERR